MCAPTPTGARRPPSLSRTAPPPRSSTSGARPSSGTAGAARRRRSAAARGAESGGEAEGEDADYVDGKSDGGGGGVGRGSDEEAEYLAEIEEQHAKAKVKDRFWRRDADFIADDDEEEEEGEGEEEEGGGGYDDEALEEGQRGPRAAELPLHVRRLDDADLDRMQSETQRLLRQDEAKLAGHSEKAIQKNHLLASIQRRRVEVAVERAAKVGFEADEDDVAEGGGLSAVTAPSNEWVGSEELVMNRRACGGGGAGEAVVQPLHKGAHVQGRSGAVPRLLLDTS